MGRRKKVRAEESIGEREVAIVPIKFGILQFTLVGKTDLLSNQFSKKNRDQILGIQTGDPKERKKRDPAKEVEDAKYKLADGRCAFPAAAFKKAMVEAAPYLEGMDKKLVKGSIQIQGELIPLKYKKQIVNESLVTLGSGSKDLRFRPQFQGWSVELWIKYNRQQITSQQIANLLNLAGFHIGVGDWRPQRSGSYGQFEVINKPKEKGE
jgi:hypothetical protein